MGNIRAYTTYEASAAITAIVAGAACAQLKTQPAIDPGTGLQNIFVGLVRLEVILTTAVASLLALAKPVAVGTSSTDTTGLKVGTALGGFANGNGSILSTAWSAVPVVSSTVYRREQLPATIGAKLVWEWPEDNPFQNGDDLRRWIFAGKGILLANLGVAASAAMVVNYRWIEYSGVVTG